MKDQQPTVKPDIENLTDIISGIERGELLVPNFQRPFVWKPNDMISLFDSIYKSYPIGSLLFWTSTESCLTLDKIGPFKINKTKDYPLSYILDGHQRLSTLYGTLKPFAQEQKEIENLDWIWQIYFDLEEEKFVHIKTNKPIPVQFFPLRKILKTVDFIGQTRQIFTEITDITKAEQYIEKAESLVSIIKAYRIPITEIKGGTIGEAINIFARLNSEGQKMSTDMMYSALTYSETEAGSFSFSERITEIQDKLSEYNFSEIDRMLIFRSVLAAKDKDIYIKIKGKSNIDLLREIIDKDELPQVVDECEEAILKAVQFLHERIGVPTHRFLPYYLQFIAFSEFFRICPNPSEAKQNTMERWFWTSSFCGIESVNNSIKNNTLEEVKNYAKLPEEKASNFKFETVSFEEPATPLPDQFNLNSSRVQAFILFLISKQPKSIISSTPIDTSTVLLNHGSKAFATIIKNRKWSMDIANRVVIQKLSERSKIKKILKEANMPLLTIDKGVLASQFITDYSLILLEQNEVKAFLEERKQYLIEEEIKFMKSKNVTPPNTDEPFLGLAP